MADENPAPANNPFDPENFKLKPASEADPNAKLPEVKEFKLPELEVKESSDFEKSAAKAEELRAGRNQQDIPLNDAYWTAVNDHRRDHNK
jgi:hypothetical protein